MHDDWHADCPGQKACYRDGGTALLWRNTQS